MACDPCYKPWLISSQQKLGVITLVEKEEVVELYDWCGLTIKSKDKVSQELEELKAQLKTREEEAKKLDDAMAEMVKVKNDHENELIEKFSLLLNEKKLKIRDQQRLLAGANVDPAKVDAVERSRTPAGSTSAGPSKARKRKTERELQDDSNSDDGFEKMDVDVQAPNDSQDEQAETPDQMSTADEASDDEVPQTLPPTRETGGDTKAAGRDVTAKPSTSTAQAEPESLPPRRELPFSKKPPSKRAPPSPKPAATGESETESDNDEL
jgi:hypothetical protein